MPSEQSVGMLGGLPPRPHPFVDRATELETLRTAVLDSDTAAVLVTGIPGIGKTALVLEFAYRAREQELFERGVAWIPGHSLSAESDLEVAVGEALGVPAVDVVRLLRTHPCLLVVDDLDAIGPPESSAGLLVLRRLIDMVGRRSEVLAAGRSVPAGLDEAQVLQLGGLDEEGTRALLASLPGEDGSDALPERDLVRLLEVARALDYHPLSLLIVARLLEDQETGRRTELDRAVRQIRNLLVHAGADGGEKWRAALLHTLATVYQERGDLKDALAAYQESLSLAREGADTASMQAALGNLGSLALQKGELGRAREYYEEALALARDRGDARGQAQVLSNLGLLHRLRGSDAEARELYERSLSLARQLGDRKAVVATLQQLSTLLLKEGEHTEATRLLQAAIEGARTVGDRAGEASTLAVLATAQAEMGGDLKGARALLEQSQAVARELGDRDGEGARLATLGVIYAQLGEVDRAADALDQAAGIAEELGDPKRQAHRLADLARLYGKMGRHEESVATYRRTLALHRDTADTVSTAAVALELGRLLVDVGRWYDGLALLEESLALRRVGHDPGARADVIYEIGRTQHLMGNLDEARVRYRDAARLYERADNACGLAAARAGIGRLMIQLGFPEDAQHELEAARAGFETVGDAAHLAETDEMLRLVSRVRGREVA